MDEEDIVRETFLKLQATRYSVPLDLSKGPILVRCVLGCDVSPQVHPFQIAMGEIQVYYEELIGKPNILQVEYLTLNQLRMSKWSVDHLIRWLQESHIHFIICHIHQGTENILWPISEIYAKLQLLKYHEGWPKLEKLDCAVFTQDKYKYLEHIPPHMRMLCHKVGLRRNMDLVKLSQWIRSVASPESKWVCKCPFVTNRQHYHKYCIGPDQILRYVERTMKDMYGEKPSCYEIPYFILQEKVDDKKEVKICFLNRKFSHIAAINRDAMSFEKHTTESLVNFASNVLDLLSEKDSSYIFDGLVRVDLFLHKGNLVVNELESLQANYSSRNGNNMHRVEMFLKNYWDRNINECVISLLS